MSKEYISKHEMIKELKTQIILGAPKFNEGLKVAMEVAANIPAADVVEVARCRDCKHSEPYGLDLKCNKHSSNTKNKLGEEIGFIEWHTPHFFCSDGEMRNGTREIPCIELVTDKYVGRKCKPCKPTQPECGCCEFVESGGAVMDGGQDE